MDLGLKNRRAFVAGSSSGIGAGMAIGLAREGCEVIVHGRKPERAAEVVDRIRKEGGKAISVIGELDTMPSVDDLAARALQTGPIDILINSAGACQDARDGLRSFSLKSGLSGFKAALIFESSRREHG